MIGNGEGGILTPSVVIFGEHDIIVGKQASKLGVMKADRLAECVTRDMGNPFYSRPIDGQFLPPEVIQACVLKKIRQDITKKIGPDFGVVITVPAFFDDSRRRTTAIAGKTGTDRQVAMEIARDAAVAGDRIGQWKDTVCGDAGVAAYRAVAEEQRQVGEETAASVVYAASTEYKPAALEPVEEAPASDEPKAAK